MVSTHTCNFATYLFQAVTKRAGRGAKGAVVAKSTKSTAGPAVRKAVYETSKKKEVGVSDLTLLSKITNEAINDNLRKRFEHKEIYVNTMPTLFRDCSLFNVLRLTSDMC